MLSLPMIILKCRKAVLGAELSSGEKEAREWGHSSSNGRADSS